MMLKMQMGKLQVFLISIGVWTFVGLTLAGISYLAVLGEGEQVSAWAIFSTNLIRFYIWAALSPLIFRIARRIDANQKRNIFTNVLIHIPLSLLFSAFHSVIYTLIAWQLYNSYSERYSSIVKFFQQYVFFASIYLGILIYALIVISVQAFLLYRRYQVEESRNSQLRVELAGAQLQALKMQLQPHFLFNTLHSISSLNTVNPQKANVMIARLGEFLRMTLEHSDEQMVTFAEELDFLRCYLEIEQTRFSDRLIVEYDIDPETLSASVPHLILQPIVENAVKHGIAPYAAPGRITISARKTEKFITLEVADNGMGIEENLDLIARELNGKGLRNVRSRLAQIYGSRFRFEMKNVAETGLIVTLEIPQTDESDLAVGV